MKATSRYSQYYLILFTCLIIFSCNTSFERGVIDDVSPEGPDSGYDSLLAGSLSADEYGMHKYYFVMLSKGPNRNQDSATAANLQRGHLDNISRLAAQGKLVLAGPFLDEGPWRGIYVFDLRDSLELDSVLVCDPAIKAGRLNVEVHLWYGSAALKLLDSLHKKVAKKPL